MQSDKMRHIREIKNLPISQLTDEEIVKAAMYILKSKAAMLVYQDSESLDLIFLGRYRKDGYQVITALRKAWSEKFGKLIKIVK
jgi:hypothetical protein